MTFEDLVGPQWAELLPKADELLTPVRAQLNSERREGILILPEKSEQIFRIFQELSPEKVRVVWLGQDPYHNPIGQATGRAFECGKHPSPTWRKIAEIYKQEVISPSPAVVNGNLTKWVEQGVFLLNKSLTVRHRMPSSHLRHWEPFTRYVMGTILTDLRPKAVVLLGAEAQRTVGRVPGPHKGFIYEHPAAASYQGRAWQGKGVFKSINEFLTFHGTGIEW